MGKLGPVQEQTMEEILASIRRMISEGDPGGVGPRPIEPRLVETNRPVGNIARLFAEAHDKPDPADADEEVGTPDNVVELAMAQAMEDAEATVRSEGVSAAQTTADPEPEPAPPATVEPAMTAPLPEADTEADTEVSPVNAAPEVTRDATPGALNGVAAAPASLPPPEERRQPLLSPRSDAMVGSAFNQLASSMLSGSARTIDELVEDLLRPMLRSWLDMNLPPLVERLVREEIERVSRGRR